MKEITLSVKRYKELAKAEIKLSMIECGGVDSWDWYGESLNPEGEKSYQELCKEIDEDYPEDN